MAALQGLFFGAYSCGIHMALHKMPIEPIPHPEAAFDVYFVAGLPGAQIGFR